MSLKRYLQIKQEGEEEREDSKLGERERNGVPAKKAQILREYLSKWEEAYIMCKWCILIQVIHK